MNKKESVMKFELNDGEYTHPMSIRGASSVEIVKDDKGYPSILMIDGKIKIQMGGGVDFLDPNAAEYEGRYGWS